MDTQELKVLLIEDNPGDAFLIKFYLGESTNPLFQVSHAEEMKTALELLSKNNFDIILSDMNLPDSFGMDTIKTVVTSFPGNLIIVLTGLTDEEVGLETVRYGAQDFLVKGKFDGKVLISTVMFAFERFKLNKQIDKYSKQLLDKSVRFDNIQYLLSCGYMEVDFIKSEIYWSDVALEILELGAHHKFSGIDKSLEIINNPIEARNHLNNAFNEKSSVTFTSISKGNNKTYKFQLSFRDDKLAGVVTAV